MERVRHVTGLMVAIPGYVEAVLLAASIDTPLEQSQRQKDAKQRHFFTITNIAGSLQQPTHRLIGAQNSRRPATRRGSALSDCSRGVLRD